MLPPERVTQLTRTLISLAFTTSEPVNFAERAADALAGCMEADAVFWFARNGGKVFSRVPEGRKAVVDLADSAQGFSEFLQETPLEGPLQVSDTRESAEEPSLSLARSGFLSFLLLPLTDKDGGSGAAALAWINAGPPLAGGPALSEVLAGLLSLGFRISSDRQLLTRAERKLSLSEQAAARQEKLRALGLLASGVAHNINNLLSPITGYSDLLLRGEPNISDNGRRLLKIMRNAGRDISEVVLRLNQFSGRADEKEKMPAVNLAEIVSEMIQLTRPYWKDMPQKQGFPVELGVNLPEGQVTVRGNSGEIRQAMTNLMINAVDALTAGGSVSVSVSGNDDCAVFEIADNGSGMDQKTMDRSIDPFFSTKDQGSGMGLSVVYGVMRHHGGRVEIDSEQGRGTRIRLIFPLGPALADELAPVVERKNGVPLKVLYVDDEPEVCEVMQQILESLGHAAEAAEGGAKGIEVFSLSVEKQAPFDLVITDMGMPKVDGLAVARAVKTASPKTPVLLFSGWSAETLEKNKGASVVDGIVSKPPTIDKVNQMIQSLMAGRRK
ncbi:MAG: ATP-binding protein [Thermodesulfobacteriota bacterium]